MLRADLGDVFVTSVSFTDTTVEFTFFEKRHQQDRAALMQHLILQNDVLGPELEELVMMMNELVDRGLKEVRNPAPVLDPRKRLEQGASFGEDA